MKTSNNPFLVNPFSTKIKPIEISKVVNELTRKKYHSECNKCGANVDRIRITCSECGQSYCRDCAEVTTGICHQCTKKEAGRAANKSKAIKRPGSSTDKDDGIEDNGKSGDNDNGIGRKLHKFSESWESARKS